MGLDAENSLVVALGLEKPGFCTMAAEGHRAQTVRSGLLYDFLYFPVARSLDDCQGQTHPSPCGPARPGRTSPRSAVSESPPMVDKTLQTDLQRYTYPEKKYDRSASRQRDYRLPVARGFYKPNQSAHFADLQRLR